MFIYFSFSKSLMDLRNPLLFCKDVCHLFFFRVCVTILPKKHNSELEFTFLCIRILGPLGTDFHSWLQNRSFFKT